MSATVYHIPVPPSPVPRLTQLDVDLRLSLYADLVASLLVIADELDQTRKRPCLDTTVQEWVQVAQTLVSDSDPGMKSLAKAYAVELVESFLGR